MTINIFFHNSTKKQPISPPLPDFNRIIRLILRVRDMKNQTKIAKQNQESNHIHQEKLRQARAIFNLKFNLLKVSIVTAFASVLLIYSGNLSVEKVEAAQGVINAIVLLTHEITKDTNNRLDNNKND